MENNLQVTKHDFLIYKDGNNDVHVSVLLINDELWFNIEQIAVLYNDTLENISKYINNIYMDNELKEADTMRKFGNSEFSKETNIYYNLEMIIAIGFRVLPEKRSNFRIWSTKVLKEYMIKGYALDDERLKNPDYIFADDYFDELLQKISLIKSSGRKFYQKITDLYATSIDYDKDSDITIKFYKSMLYKMNNNRIYDDVLTTCLDYAEVQAKEHNALTMNDWINKFNGLLL